MILQLHKFQVELEESKQKHLEQTEKIKVLEAKNEECRSDINELTKTKERLTEQSGFLQKSLDRKKIENNELSERLKQADMQLRESGSVLATVKNLESKNELLGEKMSNVLLNTEEEIAKAKTEREHYMKLLEDTAELNKRNVEIHNELCKAKEIGDEHTQQAKVYKLQCKNVQVVYRAPMGGFTKIICGLLQLQKCSPLLTTTAANYSLLLYDKVDRHCFKWQEIT